MASSSSGAAAPPSWNANFIGRKIVTGPLNDIGLSLVVTDLRAAKACDDSVRCNVEFGDRWVLRTVKTAYYVWGLVLCIQMEQCGLVLPNNWTNIQIELSVTHIRGL